MLSRKSVKMNITKPVLFTLLFLGCNARALYACNCEPVLQLGAADWNDADIIFTATLLEHKMGMVGMLKFEPEAAFKGEAPHNITLYFQPGKNHTLLHAIKEFINGDEWIVFARKRVKDGRVYYSLKESPSRVACALSRPLRKAPEVDPYILFLQDMSQKAEGYRTMYDENGGLMAEGAYIAQIPVNHWAYYQPERKMAVSGNYVNGEREGEWVQTKETSDGGQQLIRKTLYRNGDIAEIHDYSYTGKVSLTKILTDSTETRLYYRPDGTLKNRIFTGLENNTSHIINYSEDERIREEQFLENKKVVRQYWYDENGARIKEMEAEDGG